MVVYLINQTSRCHSINNFVEEQKSSTETSSSIAPSFEYSFSLDVPRKQLVIGKTSVILNRFEFWRKARS